MYINPLTLVSSAPAPQASTKVDNKDIPNTDFNEFIKLFIAQLKNQDPTAPTDATQFISQIASFSALKAAKITNDKLDHLYQSNLVSEATHYIGKHVESLDKKLSGNIKSVTLLEDGVIATLDDSKNTKIILGPGYIISDNNDKKFDKPVTLANTNVSQALPLNSTEPIA